MLCCVVLCCVVLLLCCCVAVLLLWCVVLLFTSVVAAIDPDTSIQNMSSAWLAPPLELSEFVGGDNMNVTSLSVGISSGIKSTSFPNPQYSQIHICKQINHIINRL